jgi:predicted PurR-regulated permease PerM
VFQLIEKLRQKPDGAKKRIAFLVSFSFSVCIFVIWLTVVFPDFNFIEKQKQKAKVPETGAISIFIQNIKQSFGSIKEEAGMIKNLINNTVSNVSTTTYYSLEGNMDNKDSTSTSMNSYSTSTNELEPSF